MKIPIWLHRKLLSYALETINSRKPDFIIERDNSIYLERWRQLEKWFTSCKIHKILRSDYDDLHCHPWMNLSILLQGSYIEHRIHEGGWHQKTKYEERDLVFRWATTPHRLEISDDNYAISLFLTGSRLHKWGFFCKDKGFVYYKDYLDMSGQDENRNGVSKVAKGCGD